MKSPVTGRSINYELKNPSLMVRHHDNVKKLRRALGLSEKAKKGSTKAGRGLVDIITDDLLIEVKSGFAFCHALHGLGQLLYYRQHVPDRKCIVAVYGDNLDYNYFEGITETLADFDVELITVDDLAARFKREREDMSD